MKKFINKNFFAAFMFAAIMSVTSVASAADFTSPVNIEQVGKMKFIVRAEPKSSFVVIIYDAENNILYNEMISTQKVFSFSNLSDGKYRMDIINSHKKLVQSKSFNIQTEVKRDLVAVQ
jgi:hypothetical protein